MTTKIEREKWAIKKGFESNGAYQQHLVIKKGFKSHHDYQKNIIKKRGYESLHDYQKHIGQIRQKRRRNQNLSNLIKTGLETIKKNQSWLSREINVSRESVSKYSKGTYVPKQEILEKIYSALNIPYETLDGKVEIK